MSSNTPSLPSSSAKPQRILACVLCQQRKIRCDRKFPCANCIRSRVQCVSASLTLRQRKRRFAERDLLERLRKYEGILRQHNIPFEPLHGTAGKDKEPESNDIAENEHESGDELAESTGRVTTTDSPSSTTKTGESHEAKNIWHAMTHEFRDPDGASDSSQEVVGEAVVKKAWERAHLDDHHLLFGSRDIAVDLSAFHPEPAHIFRLWQVYLENVNPLLKVTHVPSLQGRIVEAASNVVNVDPNLEALMFACYCVSVQSLAPEACQTMFGSAQEDLLTRYHFGCQQALANCDFMRTNSRDCLTALFLYVISIRHSTVPQSLFSIIGLAIRTAQRLGFHSESLLAHCTVFEAEMRRRLWWSLVLFDARIAEMASSRVTILEPTWDCKIPLNVNDSDLRPEMREVPRLQGISTDALFAVLYSEIGNFVRHAGFHLDFTNPALRPIARYAHKNADAEEKDLIELEERIETQYLKHCDQENPAQFMAVWFSRSFIAKCRLLQHHSRFSNSSVRQTDAQRDGAAFHAFKMLECDTKIMASSLTQRFAWYKYLHFPFPAYLQLAQDLKARPFWEHGPKAWNLMSDNREAWFSAPRFSPTSPFFGMFSRMILQAWDAYESAHTQSKGRQEGDAEITVPRIVLSIKRIIAEVATQDMEKSDGSKTQQDADIDMIMGMDDFLMPLSTSIPMSMNRDMGMDMGIMGIPGQPAPLINMDNAYGIGIGTSMPMTIPESVAMMRPDVFAGGGGGGGGVSGHPHTPSASSSPAPPPPATPLLSGSPSSTLSHLQQQQEQHRLQLMLQYQQRQEQHLRWIAHVRRSGPGI